MKLTIKNWYEIAKIIDNDFIGSMDTFTADKKEDFYFLSTNKCDSSSLIKCFFKNNNIYKIVRLCGDTDGYQEIQPQTQKRVNEYLASLIK